MDVWVHDALQHFVTSLFFCSGFFLSLYLAVCVCECLRCERIKPADIIFYSHRIFFFDVWCCCNRLVFIYVFILLVAFFLVFHSVTMRSPRIFFFSFPSRSENLFLDSPNRIFVIPCRCPPTTTVAVHLFALLLTTTPSRSPSLGPVIFFSVVFFFERSFGRFSLVMWTNAFSISIIF